MTETRIDTEGLRRIRAAATPGEWEEDYGTGEVIASAFDEYIDVAKQVSDPDAALIVYLANHATQIADELDALRAVVDAWSESDLDALRKWTDRAAQSATNAEMPSRQRRAKLYRLNKINQMINALAAYLENHND